MKQCIVHQMNLTFQPKWGWEVGEAKVGEMAGIKMKQGKENQSVE